MSTPKWRRACAVLTVALGMTATIALQPAPAEAAAPPASFYQPPATLPARNGDVIRTTPTNLGYFGGNARSTAVLYRSTDANGRPIAVSGTLLVPNAAWTGAGPRPIVSFAVGTQGMGDRCAPSTALTANGTLEFSVVQGLVDRGWAVAVTDYEGLGTPGDHAYTVKDSAAHAVLDIVRAAQRIPNSGVAANAPVGIFGYSQGGQAAAGAAELEATYAPELDVRATVAGGVPSDLQRVGQHLNTAGGFYFSFLLYAQIGLDTAYPELDLEGHLNPTGTTLVNTMRNSCLLDGLFGALFQRIENLTTRSTLTDPAWIAAAARQRLGTVRPAAPVLLYHGSADTIIPPEQGTTLRDAWCGRGARVRWVSPFGDHLGGITGILTDAAPFLQSAFAGQPLTTTCN